MDSDVGPFPQRFREVVQAAVELIREDRVELVPLPEQAWSARCRGPAAHADPTSHHPPTKSRGALCHPSCHT